MTAVNEQTTCQAGKSAGAGGDTGAGGGAGARAHEERKAKIAQRMAMVKHKLIVMSGKGGVGKSTVAAYLAMELASRGKKVGLMDADIHGPSIPKMLGLGGKRPALTGAGMAPVECSKNLGVMSVGFLLSSSEQPIIWRGPLKMGLIEDFLANVEWGSLDYLIVDSPPGTGDEPLSVCQLIPDLDGALIISTPQDIALADVEKSITFCHKVNTPVLGVVENMSGLACPHCGKEIDLFKSGGAERLADRMAVPFLGKIPIVPEVVEACDRGNCSLANITSGPLKDALKKISMSIMKLGRSSSGTNSLRAGTSTDTGDSGQARARKSAGGDTQPGAACQRISLPLDGDRLSTHFGHAPRFAIYDVENGEITGEILLTPPPHAPGIIPSWLKDQGVTVVIANGLGRKAMAAFEKSGMTVVCGAAPAAPRDVVKEYLDGRLATGENVCDH